MAMAFSNKLCAWLLACGLTYAVADGVSKQPQSADKQAQSAKAPARGTGKMQVEEPAADAAVNPAGVSQAWQRSHAQGLTAEQKRAFRERKDKMGEMIALIKEKRMAMADAPPEERAVLARELHSLILEKDPEAKDDAAAARTKPQTDEGAASGKAGKKNGSEESMRKQVEMLKHAEKRKDEQWRPLKEKAKPMDMGK